MDIAAFFAEQFPIASEHFSLEYVAEIVDEPTGEVRHGVQEHRDQLRVTLRTVVWDSQDGVRSIRDIREQDVCIAFGPQRDDPRLPAYLEGWVAALRFVLARHEELRAAGTASDRLEYALPSDLVCSEVLRLRRPRTADEFTDALLSSSKRLGRLLA